MSVYFDSRFDLVGSRQGETDYDQQREERSDSVDHFLHDLKLPLWVGGAGLFHRKDTMRI
jgi:hypothetical protein